MSIAASTVRPDLRRVLGDLPRQQLLSADLLPLESGQPSPMLDVVRRIGRHAPTSLTDPARPAGTITAFAGGWISICLRAGRCDALAVDIEEVDPTANVARPSVAVLPGGRRRLGRIGFEHEVERYRPCGHGSELADCSRDSS